MRRTSLALILVSVVSALPRAAYAEEPTAAQQSCETVTTVRCTGAVAPLALPGNTAAQAAYPPAPPQAAYPPAPPQAAYPPVPPQAAYPPVPPQAAYPPVPPQAAYPPALDGTCPACGAPSPYLRTARLPAPALAGGWQLTLDEHGAQIYERKVRSRSPGVWVAGLTMWLGSYLGTSIGGFRDERPWAAIPFFGAFGAGGADLLGGDLGRGAGYTMGGLLQLTGFIMFVAGAAGSSKIERLPVRVAPLAFREGGGGVSLAARF